MAVKGQVILKKTVVLVGLMGCGKSSVGKRLAERLKVPFIDSDHVIEERAGSSITQLFEAKGEAYFRELEYEVLSGILNGQPSILATGGGAYIQERIRELIHEKAVAVWLNAEFDILLERVSRKKTRPLLEQGNKAEILKNLMDVRYPIYANADIVVASGNGPHSIVVNKVVEELLKHQYAFLENIKEIQ